MPPSTPRTFCSTPCLAWRCDQEKDSRAPQGTSCGMANDMTFDARRAIFVQIIPWMIIDDYRCIVIEGSLEAKLPTIWKDGNGTARKKLGRGES